MQARSLPIGTRRMVVTRGRLVCEVEVDEERFRMTTPALAARALKDFPELARHACVNDAGAVFGDVIACTPTPHLLEHVAITLQVRSARSERASFTGSTSYVERGSKAMTHVDRESTGASAVCWREACVELSFSDDLAALRAYKEALAYVNGVLRDTIG